MELPYPLVQAGAAAKKVGGDILTGAIVGAVIAGVVSTVLVSRRLYQGKSVNPRRKKK